MTQPAPTHQAPPSPRLDVRSNGLPPRNPGPKPRTERPVLLIQAKDLRREVYATSPTHDHSPQGAVPSEPTTPRTASWTAAIRRKMTQKLSFKRERRPSLDRLFEDRLSDWAAQQASELGYGGAPFAPATTAPMSRAFTEGTQAAHYNQFQSPRTAPLGPAPYAGTMGPSMVDASTMTVSPTQSMHGAPYATLPCHLTPQRAAFTDDHWAPGLPNMVYAGSLRRPGADQLRVLNPNPASRASLASLLDRPLPSIPNSRSPSPTSLGMKPTERGLRSRLLSFDKSKLRTKSPSRGPGTPGKPDPLAPASASESVHRARHGPASHQSSPRLPFPVDGHESIGQTMADLPIVSISSATGARPPTVVGSTSNPSLSSLNHSSEQFLSWTTYGSNDMDQELSDRFHALGIEPSLPPSRQSLTNSMVNDSPITSPLTSQPAPLVQNDAALAPSDRVCHLEPNASARADHTMVRRRILAVNRHFDELQTTPSPHPSSGRSSKKILNHVEGITNNFVNRVRGASFKGPRNPKLTVAVSHPMSLSDSLSPPATSGGISGSVGAPQAMSPAVTQLPNGVELVSLDQAAMASQSPATSASAESALPVSAASGSHLLRSSDTINLPVAKQMLKIRTLDMLDGHYRPAVTVPWDVASSLSCDRSTVACSPSASAASLTSLPVAPLSPLTPLSPKLKPAHPAPPNSAYRLARGPVSSPPTSASASLVPSDRALGDNITLKRISGVSLGQDLTADSPATAELKSGEVNSEIVPGPRRLAKPVNNPTRGSYHDVDQPLRLLRSSSRQFTPPTAPRSRHNSQRPIIQTKSVSSSTVMEMPANSASPSSLPSAKVRSTPVGLQGNANSEMAQCQKKRATFPPAVSPSSSTEVDCDRSDETTGSGADSFARLTRQAIDTSTTPAPSTVQPDYRDLLTKAEFCTLVQDLAHAIYQSALEVAMTRANASMGSGMLQSGAPTATATISEAAGTRPSSTHSAISAFAVQGDELDLSMTGVGDDKLTRPTAGNSSWDMDVSISQIDPNLTMALEGTTDSITPTVPNVTSATTPPVAEAVVQPEAAPIVDEALKVKLRRSAVRQSLMLVSLQLQKAGETAQADSFQTRPSPVLKSVAREPDLAHQAEEPNRSAPPEPEIGYPEGSNATLPGLVKTEESGDPNCEPFHGGHSHEPAPVNQNACHSDTCSNADDSGNIDPLVQPSLLSPTTTPNGGTDKHPLAEEAPNARKTRLRASIRLSSIRHPMHYQPDPTFKIAEDSDAHSSDTCGEGGDDDDDEEVDYGHVAILSHQIISTAPRQDFELSRVSSIAMSTASITGPHHSFVASNTSSNGDSDESPRCESNTSLLNEVMLASEMHPYPQARLGYATDHPNQYHSHHPPDYSRQSSSFDSILRLSETPYLAKLGFNLEYPHLSSRENPPSQACRRSCMCQIPDDITACIHDDVRFDPSELRF
ncbi:hypothetical protein IWQ60_003204 [Tieghemiomyces parasiticus]|uniref:Uncharacterized protein n=1 Tax=Tieghemiomyces parasiticus TaxID=78921 RepID=A0A9W8DWN8_9FUNG|nr:hypothetical protein IWQ60_003204 [Tieghemiomyces parasiticus]